jgi:lipopolysaccharide heptosyltransferase II
MRSKESNVKKILVISLTNIGDVILTLPVVDILRRDFVDAELSVVIGPKAQSLLAHNPKLKKVYIYDKHQPVAATLRWVWELRRQRFDLVVDLRNSFTPFLIGARRRTPAARIKQENVHMKKKHLRRLSSVHAFASEKAESILHISPADKMHIDKLLERSVGVGHPFIALAPGSAYHAKRWSEAHFARLTEELNIRFQMPVVFIGDGKDTKVAAAINALLPIPETDLTGQTTLIQLAELIKRAQLVITNDSAPMHLASYLGRPVLALFGPSQPHQYGPWSTTAGFIHAQEKQGVRDINAITPEDVLSRLTLSGGEFSIS